MTTCTAATLGLEFPPEAADPRHRQHALLRRRVAELPDRSIREMWRDELIVAIRTAGLTFWRHVDEERLQYADRATLERLTFLARRACRNGGDCVHGTTSFPRKPR